MNWFMIKNDFRRNKIINLALLLFIIFSASLAVSSVLTAVQTITSISDLYDIAQPPHFVQMHKGDIDQSVIDEFMDRNESVVYWQTQKMIDVYGESITIVGEDETYDLSDLRLDIGLVTQNDTKDLLLNSDHEKVIIHEGEIGIPVLLREMYGMEIGNRVILTSNNLAKEFVIKEFILDSMMNSTMTSSTRILLSDVDYQILEGRIGEYEYLIEAYFTDSNEASIFQTAYENSGLSQNGQAVTYTIIFILSALTDIVIVFVLLLVSILLIFISFICIKYTIMAALEEDIAEIGTLKAIGLTFVEIRRLYLYKYRAITIVGVILGYILALLISNVFTSHISATFGNVRLTPMTLIISLIVGLLVYLIMDYYCKKVLKKIKRLTVVDALVTGKGFEKAKGSIKDGLHKHKKLTTNYLMAIREVFYKFKNWIIVFSVVLIAVMIILIPINLLNTFEAPEFITYMGSSLEDIMIEVENGINLESNYVKVKSILGSDTEIQNYYEYRRISVQTIDSENEFMNLHIDSGDNSGNELQYLSGGAPKGKNEIAISYLNAERIGKTVGDKIVLLFDNKEHKFHITGIYQDVTSGGYTAKSTNDFAGLPTEKYTFSVNLNKDEIVTKKAKEWSDVIGVGVSIDPMKEFINQTLGGVVVQLKAIVTAIVVIGACMAMLITVLFLRLRLAKDLSEIAVLKAIGFSEADVKQQYMIKIAYVALTGIVVGILLTNLLGERIVNLALSIGGIGIKKVELISNPVMQYILCPLVLLVLILLVTRVVMNTIKNYNLISIIKE